MIAQNRFMIGFAKNVSRFFEEYAAILVHQSIQISFGRREVKQDYVKYICGPALALFPVLALVYIVHFFTNDVQKSPQILYIKYRFGIAIAMMLLFAIAVIWRKSLFVVQGTYLALASLIATAQAWSMTLGPVVSIKWVVWIPSFIFVVVSNSFLFSTFWILMMVYLTRPFWEGHDVGRALFSDLVFAILLLFLSQIVKRISILSKLNRLRYERSREALEDEQRIFHSQLSRFIAPVFISRMEREKKIGRSAIAAIDVVLRREKRTVAVMYSDIAGFSERSDADGFIEQELIPSATSIIDAAEKNMGVAKQVGDAVLVFYDLDDPEESLLRALLDCMRCAFDEDERVKTLGRNMPERYFSAVLGNATVGNMASASHREATIIGYPANLSSRIDSLTRHQSIKSLITGTGFPSVGLWRL